HPIEAMNDRWQVISVTHHGWQPVASNDGGEGTTLTNEVAFIPGRQDWRPPYRYKPLADGDEVATVVGPGSEEIYVNEHGAIRIHFHWNRYDKADDNASCWVRVAQGWNGNGFGFMAIPRVGQEVIVSYLNGDIDRPIVTGCTYNGLNRPPLNLPLEKTRTTFKTRTLGGQGFNELRFEDARGSEEVFIHA
ncbi:type VI secretion system tip protein TssI/VgrG, partial [Photorhabdus caribbeanensis]|uniref:type VI secretion system tip protein TssI/VgrG n=1 Tax=Photorhabdus caribbeanensis TaxID=1004165 RepID=UPI001BD5E72F